jgi:hypothetical protein
MLSALVRNLLFTRTRDFRVDSMIGMNDSAGRRRARPDSHIKGIDDKG